MKINDCIPTAEGIRSFLPQAPKFNTNITPKITAVALAILFMANLPGSLASGPEWVECVQRCIENSDSPFRFTICPVFCIPFWMQ